MDQGAELKKIREELEQLRETVGQQEEKIGALQQQVKNGLRRDRGNRSSGQFISNIHLENFIGLRLIHLVGIVVLVIGLSIGVKYAIDRDLISESLRILLAYAAGAVLFFLSLRLYNKYNFFSAILFSGAMASLYFTTYAGFAYYELFPFALAFAIMIALTVFTVYKALVYNREEIAILGMVGAYGIPFLVNMKSERIDLLFLYIGLINAGVAWVVIRRRWKLSGRIAQAITWLMILGWVVIRYNISIQPLALGIVAYFFLLFSFMIAGQRIFHKLSFTINDVYQQVLNNIALYISALFVFGYAEDIAQEGLITLAMSLIVALQALLAHYVLKEELAKRLLAALSFMFFILFIGFQWTGVTVTMLWLFTAVIAFILGYHYRSVTARMASITLMGLTLGKLLLSDSQRFSPGQKIVSYIVLGILLLVVSFFYQKFRGKIFDEKE